MVKAKITQKEKFESELSIVKMLDHPNIVRLYEAYQDESKYYLVFELCEGGELFERVTQNVCSLCLSRTSCRSTKLERL